jgi:hypothetical protein
MVRALRMGRLMAYPEVRNENVGEEQGTAVRGITGYLRSRRAPRSQSETWYATVLNHNT